MTTISEPRGAPSIVYDEPPAKSPPALVVGPLAWVRNNLFSSWFNTVLTLVASGVLVSVVVSFVNWVVTQANWFVVIFNLRQFMVGRYEVEAEWRLQIMALLIAFVVGIAIAAWARVSQLAVVALIVGLVLLFVIPAAISVIPLPSAYFAVGDVEITSGASSQRPPPMTGFIARAGERISVRLADHLTDNDVRLRTLNSFADNGANLLRAAAVNRLANEARLAEIDALLLEHAQRGPTLTVNQIAALEAERERLEIPEPITETYRLNQAPVTVRILRGTTLEPVAEGVIEPLDEAALAGVEQGVEPRSLPFVTTLSEDGWYILETRVEDGLALLETHGIYPILIRSFSRSEELDASGNVISAAGRYNEFARMTDGFTTQELRPRIDNRDVPAAIIIDNQYRGARTFSDYLKLYVAPFLSIVNVPLLLMAGAAVGGYALTKTLNRTVPARQKARNPRYVAQRLSVWTLTALPFVMFLLAYGVGNLLPITDTRRWGGLLLTIMLTMVGVIASFPLGVLLALGRRSNLPVVSGACTAYIEFVRGVPLITVLFMAQLLVPLINPTLANVDNVFRAMVGIILFSAAYLAENVRGGLQSIPPGQEEAAKALGLAGWQVTLFITLPQALRAVIPALVGQFISLFKDTSLVAIVGLVDLTGISQATVAQTEFLGLRREVYIFITLIYFVFSYVMAALSRRLEASGSGAARRL